MRKGGGVGILHPCPEALKYLFLIGVLTIVKITLHRVYDMWTTDFSLLHTKSFVSGGSSSVDMGVIIRDLSIHGF